MVKIDQRNSLTVTDIGPYGTYVDGAEHGPLRLRGAPEDLAKGDTLEVFVYRDAASQVVATTSAALAQIGECAYLKVVSVGDHGAFLDWGLPKDLLLPYSEQAYPVRTDNSYVVFVYLDETDRPVATTQLHKHLDEDHGNLRVGDPVNLMIAGKSDLGFKAVVNNYQLGLIYHEELSQPLQFGTRIKGWVKQVRDDGKLDLSINTLDKKTRTELEMRILRLLNESDGRIELSDKSPPEAIFAIFKVSKKNFKRALGNLYKQRLIKISPTYIELIQDK